MVHPRGEGSLGTPKSDYVICARPPSTMGYESVIQKVEFEPPGLAKVFFQTYNPLL